jgi:hypothetical protein
MYTFCIGQSLEKKWKSNEAAYQLFIDFKKDYDLFRRKIEFGNSMKLVRPIKMCLNETYSKVRVGKHLSDTFPIKNDLKKGDAL